MIFKGLQIFQGLKGTVPGRPDTGAKCCGKCLRFILKNVFTFLKINKIEYLLKKLLGRFQICELSL